MVSDIFLTAPSDGTDADYRDKKQRAHDNNRHSVALECLVLHYGICRFNECITNGKTGMSSIRFEHEAETVSKDLYGFFIHYLQFCILSRITIPEI